MAYCNLPEIEQSKFYHFSVLDGFRKLVTPISELNASGAGRNGRQVSGSVGPTGSGGGVGKMRLNERENEQIDNCAVAMQYYHPNFVRGDLMRLQLIHRRVSNTRFIQFYYIE